MRRLTILLIAAAFILLPLQDALAHGGGLNSQGCHNETATGGYHCHRDRDDDKDDWETAGAILGGLLALGLIIYMLKPKHPASSLGFAPEIAADQDGNAYVGARWKVDW